MIKNKTLLFLLVIIFLFVVSAILFSPARATDSGTITATVTAQNISISVSIGGTTPSFNYGTLGVGTTQNTVNLSKTIRASNDGNIAEKFNIEGANTTGCVWTLGSSAGTDQYKHEFSINSTFPGTALTASYQQLAASVAAASYQDFDLQITVPSSSSCYTTATAVVTVQATAP